MANVSIKVRLSIDGFGVQSRIEDRRVKATYVKKTKKALAVHRDIMNRRRWSLSHVPSGRRVLTRFKTKDDALQAGEDIWKSLTKKEKKEMRKPYPKKISKKMIKKLDGHKNRKPDINGA